MKWEENTNGNIAPQPEKAEILLPTNEPEQVLCKLNPGKPLKLRNCFC